MIKPIARYIVLKKVVEDVQSSSGMLLSAKDVSEMRYHKAEVIAVGDEVTNIRPGDIILFDKSNSYTMLLDKEQITIIQLREVVGIIFTNKIKNLFSFVIDFFRWLKLN